MGSRHATAVPEEPRIRRRARLRNKEASDLRARLAGMLGGAGLWPEAAAVETGESQGRALLLVDNEVVGLYDGAEPTGDPFLTVRGLLKYPAQGRAVTVDMGAVRFVTNGADVMGPGIVEADAGIKEGDWVWVRDERNRKPLAVGKALVAGPAMVKGKGKCVKSVHYLGDKLWGLET
jgi:PUA-domain protein